MNHVVSMKIALLNQRADYVGITSEDLNEGFAYAASLGLVITHLINIRHCRTHHAH